MIDRTKIELRTKRWPRSHDLGGWPVRLSFVRRFTWPPELHRGLWPVSEWSPMIDAAGQPTIGWHKVADGHSLFTGPLVLSWRTRRQPVEWHRLAWR